MKLFELVLGNSIESASELFVRGANYDREKNVLTIRARTSASFDTFFNLFSHGDYCEYCGIDEVLLELRAQGDYTLDFFIKHAENDSVKLLSRKCSGYSLTKADLSAAKKGGFTYFTITADTDCFIYGGSWQCEREPRRNVKIGIAICTYKREEFVKKNLDCIAKALEYEPVWKDRLHVFIVDNAGSLQIEEGDFYSVIKNRNLGGSGGFTRGICEVCDRGDFTHFLLMDDDIRFDFCVLEKTYFLLSALTDKYDNACVGGSMLVLERPCIQHEFGGIFNGSYLTSVNSGLDMREIASLLKNINAKKPDYTAWWYCCMPAVCKQKYGLPFPFFIKCDDIEYGLRAIENLILTNGIAVWHQDFEGKYSGNLEYYIKRNETVTSALHRKTGAFKVAVKFFYAILKSLTLKNYDCAELIYKAYLDLKKGSAFFMDADPENLNKQISAFKQSFMSADQIEKIYNQNLKQAKLKKVHRAKITTIIAIVTENYLPAFIFSKKAAIINAGKPDVRACLAKKTVIHYDENGEKGFVCQLDTSRRRKLRKAAVKVFFGLLFGYKKIKKDLIENRNRICSEEHWTRLFKINSETLQ